MASIRLKLRTIRLNEDGALAWSRFIVGSFQFTGKSNAASRLEAQLPLLAMYLYLRKAPKLLNFMPFPHTSKE
jgi:hypothetical protein